MIDDTHVFLKTAILKQAVNDYINALLIGDDREATYLERWFLSEWGEFLSNNNGDFIVTNVKKEFRKKVLKC